MKRKMKEMEEKARIIKVVGEGNKEKWLREKGEECGKDRERR